MSVAATRAGGKERSARKAFPEKGSVNLLFGAVSVAAIVGLGVSLGATWPEVSSRWPSWLMWASIVAAADMLPVRLWGSVSLSMSLPIALSAGMVLSPSEAGLIAFLGSVDPREFRRQVSILRGAFNRSQVAISAAAASWVFHLGGVSVSDWPQVLPAAIGALAVDFAVNAVLVCAAMALETQVRPVDVLREMLSPNPLEFGATYICLGLQAPLVSVAHSVGGPLALVAFMGPLALARQAFVRAQSLHEAAQRAEIKNRALAQVSAHVVDERRDERMTVAGELHDEVLPPLFRVHLMGQVLRQDLASGRILNLDDDLPNLLRATQDAQNALREVIRDLRRSALGAGGLLDTVKLLVSQTEAAGGPRVILEGEQADRASSLAQLLAYQVVREALSNAARHARASLIHVRIWLDNGDIRIIVEDDGLGFDRSRVDGDAHFGLQLMEERIEAVGGRAYVESRLGGGTRVVATIPSGVG